MAEERDRPRPHGDPLRREVGEDNRAQRHSDAPSDSNLGDNPDEATGASDRAGGRGSSANGVPAFDEDSGGKRRRQYEDGAGLVSGID